MTQARCRAVRALSAVYRAETGAISDVLRDKHFLRKHGPEAYYGQKTPVS